MRREKKWRVSRVHYGVSVIRNLSGSGQHVSHSQILCAMKVKIPLGQPCKRTRRKRVEAAYDAQIMVDASSYKIIQS
jgi:hypothetical protein